MITRDEPQLFTIASLPAERLEEPVLLRDLPLRLLSSAPNGAVTAFASVPCGWEATAAAAGSVDVVVLSGELEVGPERLAATGYAALPSQETACRALTDASALFFWDPRGAAPEALYTSSGWDRSWEMTTLPGVTAGLMRKRLRADDDGEAAGPGRGWIRLIHAVPGWRSPGQERHVGCWEENILLHGDMYMTGRGTMRAGDCLANPAGHWHGPMGTRGGALFLVHCDRPMTVEWRASQEPGADDVDAYLRSADWHWTESEREGVEVA